MTSRDPIAASQPRLSSFVAHSELSVTVAGAPALIAAFADRLGEVERWPGFERLEVWQDERDERRFVMVSWWADKASFAAYMGSPDHRCSHDRIPGGPDGPRPASFSRFRLVAR